MKTFIKNDNGFVCEHCGKEVSPLGYTSRNHCPYCLHSKHVDINPGDREETCHGILVPIGLEKAKKEKYKIIYKCEKCGAIRKNIMADDDNFDRILEIMKENSF